MMLTSLSLALALTAAPAAAPAKGKPVSLYELDARSLEGTAQPLSAYQGKVALVVNTASRCGYTPQLTGLQELHAQYGGKGFVVLGFPSNDFGAQEPGSPKEIRNFCSVSHKVQFPLFEKSRVKGPQKSAVYQFLSEKHGEPQWNFHKYLVGRDGKVVKAFPSDVEPDSPELKQAIEAALKG